MSLLQEVRAADSPYAGRDHDNLVMIKAEARDALLAVVDAAERAVNMTSMVHPAGGLDELEAALEVVNRQP